MGQKLQDGKKVLEMSQLHPHSTSHPVQTIHPTDLGLLPSWNSIVGPPAQEFSPSWTARKRMQERVEISWKSRKSELVKLQYNSNDYQWGTFGCPKSYYYINLYPSDDSWTLWHVSCPSWHISWPYWMVSWAIFGGNMDILAQISSYIFIGNMSVGPGNLFRGSGNGYLDT